ncbi:hepatitis A virus cellular receptor 2 homolog isoform X1 [Cricetulus griseus]|uniref:hepatitis A virus cellular receptor 2 homolog isoform X1 n=1 Tax=Cricetulus griseus TaxID=10029 RepID=UPI00022F607C|nr:hepatitis A virus cellular receptor 2 homolog isoform X1 [Cricetulus griseus]
MFSRLTFNCVLLLLLLLLARSLEDAVIVEVGKNAYLPSSYTLPTPGTPVPVCWGKGPCPWSRCGSGVVSTDERNVTYQKSRRYQLRGNFLKGDVSLTIENVTVDDHGTYCCRVEFPGLGNDKKLDLKLVIIPGLKQISTWADDMKDSGETIRMAIYIGVGVSAGLALALIFGVLILKWYSYKKKKLQNSSLITLANLPPVGIANAGAGRNRSEENIYTIEENIYEMQNSNEYYCYASNGQPS